MTDKTPAQWRAEIAWLVQRGHFERAEEARREYYTAVLAEKISATLAKSPPLSEAQLERLRSLLPVPVGSSREVS